MFAMRSALLLPGLSAVAFAAGLALAPSPVLAAHAGAPYTNVDKRNDAGNDTGDSQVDALNAAQLNQNYQPGMNERIMGGAGAGGPRPAPAYPPPPGTRP
jgi:hypothetical protein